MNKVTILRGPSGSGKSTWAKDNAPDALVLSSDDLFIDQKTGEYKWDPYRLAEVHWTTLSRFIAALLVHQAAQHGDGKGDVAQRHENKHQPQRHRLRARHPKRGSGRSA